jgi:hypothetical protein
MNKYNQQVCIKEDGESRTVYRTPALERNEEIVELITKHVILQWRILCNSPWGKENISRLDFTYHVLAVMNHMKKGGAKFTSHTQILNSNRIKVIPGNDYVAKNFPPINDMDLFNYGKKAITIGTGNLTEAYKSINSGSGIPLPVDTLHSVNEQVMRDDDDEDMHDNDSDTDSDSDSDSDNRSRDSNYEHEL